MIKKGFCLVFAFCLPLPILALDLNDLRLNWYNELTGYPYDPEVIEIKNKIIVDSTHTNSMFHHVSAREELIRQVKELRKSVYKIDESMKINCLKKENHQIY